MTLRVQIKAMLNSGNHEARVVVGTMQYFLKPGDSTEVTIYEGQDVLVSEVAAGTGERVAAEAQAKAEALAREAAGKNKTPSSAEGDVAQAPEGALDVVDPPAAAPEAPEAGPADEKPASKTKR